MMDNSVRYAAEQAVVGDAASVCGSLKSRLEGDLQELRKRVDNRASKLQVMHDEQKADVEAAVCIENALSNINGFFGPKPTTSAGITDRPYK